MKYVVIGSSGGKTRDEIMAVYPRHVEFFDQFMESGDVIGAGPFLDPDGGNMSIFRTREAAEAFAKGDPFLLEGVAKEYVIKEWADSMIK